MLSEHMLKECFNPHAGRPGPTDEEPDVHKGRGVAGWVQSVPKYLVSTFYIPEILYLLFYFDESDLSLLFADRVRDCVSCIYTNYVFSSHVNPMK